MRSTYAKVYHTWQNPTYTGVLFGKPSSDEHVTAVTYRPSECGAFAALGGSIASANAFINTGSRTDILYYHDNFADDVTGTAAMVGRTYGGGSTRPGLFVLSLRDLEQNTSSTGFTMSGSRTSSRTVIHLFILISGVYYLSGWLLCNTSTIHLS